MNSVMSINGVSVTLHTPTAVKRDGTNSLPPYCPAEAYKVDDYTECPDNWMHGSDMASSYFVPVEDGCGMWFDFTNNQYHNHDVAVVISVQGVNPITGPIKNGETAKLRLEQYINKCPRHDIDFLQDRLCPECGYKWVKQNYLCTNSGEVMWIDGFRTENNEVRQYVITAEEMAGVATQLIGDKRVWAIGFAFFLSNEPKSKQRSLQKYVNRPLWVFNPTNHDYQLTPNRPYYSSGYSGPTPRGIMRSSFSCSTNNNGIETQKLEVGMGGIINQSIGRDPNGLDYWQDNPVGMIYVNYCSKSDCERILKSPKTYKKDGPFNSVRSV